MGVSPGVALRLIDVNYIHTITPKTVHLSVIPVCVTLIDIVNKCLPAR